MSVFMLVIEVGIGFCGSIIGSLFRLVLFSMLVQKGIGPIIGLMITTIRKLALLNVLTIWIKISNQLTHGAKFFHELK